MSIDQLQQAPSHAATATLPDWEHMPTFAGFSPTQENPNPPFTVRALDAMELKMHRLDDTQEQPSMPDTGTYDSMDLLERYNAQNEREAKRRGRTQTGLDSLQFTGEHRRELRTMLGHSAVKNETRGSTYTEPTHSGNPAYFEWRTNYHPKHSSK